MPEPSPGTCFICPVCYWEDDAGQCSDPTDGDGANSVSLNEARESFLEIGAISAEARPHVRPPSPAEVPAGRQP